MAKVTYNALIKDVRCRLDNVVFSKWKDTSYVKPYKKPSNPNSPEQMRVRNAFSRLVKNWTEGDRLLRGGWENHAKGRNMTGYNAFIGANTELQKNGEPIELFKPLGEAGLASFNAAKGSSAGEIKCLIKVPAGANGKHLTIFTQKSQDGIATGPFTRHDMGAVNGEEYILTGLETGGTYFVYAVITNNRYQDASAISASNGAVSEAA